MVWSLVLSRSSGLGGAAAGWACAPTMAESSRRIRISFDFMVDSPPDVKVLKAMHCKRLAAFRVTFVTKPFREACSSVGFNGINRNQAPRPLIAQTVIHNKEKQIVKRSFNFTL